MSKLVAVIFDEPLMAEGALDRIRKLEKDKELVVEDACVVERSPEGKVKIAELKDQRAPEGAMKGSFIGLLAGSFLLAPFAGLAVGAGIGALVAKLRDHGIKDSFQKQVAERLKEGRSALVILVDDANADAAVAVGTDFGGELFHADLHPETEKQVRSELDDDET